MSSSLYDILKFYHDPKTFVIGAKTAVSDAHQRQIRNCTDRLKTITRQIGSIEDRKPSKTLSSLALQKYKLGYRNVDGLVMSAREIRALTYNMYQFSDQLMFDNFAILLKRQWRNSFINGIFHFLMTHWESESQNHLRPIISIFQEKLAIYQGNRDRYLLLKRNAKFFASNGAELLGLTLRKNDIGQSVFCSIWDVPTVYFGQTLSKIDDEYYSRVIVSYFGRDAISKIDLLRDILSVHNHDITNKRIIPQLIIQNKDTTQESVRDNLQTLAMKLIGNPDLSAKWKMNTGTAEEQKNIEEARLILKDWMKRKFIAIFFEKCVHEPSRQTFWMNHIDWISDVEVWCTPLTESLLNEDKSIEDYMEAKVNVLTCEGNVDQSALFMTIADYIFIEFSDVGCLYMFQKNSMNGRQLASKNIMYFTDIKRRKINTIQDFYLKDTEGKIDHRSGWEKTLEKWMGYHIDFDFL